MQKATDYFASFLDHTDDMLQISGRLAAQAEAEKLIVGDVQEKLKLDPSDSFLEVGCGVGNLLIPISFMVQDCVGIDHPRLLEAAQARYNGNNIRYIPGQFPKVNLSGTYNKILVYSVLAYMENEEHLFSFLTRALEHLAPSGRMMLGDIACLGHKERFSNSESGKAFQIEWQKATQNMPGTQMPPPECPLFTVTDEIVCKILLFCRERGFHSYVLEQNASLPFGNTREDIMIVGPENTEN